MPCSPTPTGLVDLTITVNPVLPPLFQPRRHPRVFISRLNHTASVSAAYASSSTLPYSHARLASGCWLGSTGREFNPLDSDERFLSNVVGFPLSWAYPVATECESRAIHNAGLAT